MSENEYVDPKLIELELHDRLNLSLNEIKNYVASAGVILSSDDIKNYLDRSFKNDHEYIYNSIKNNDYLDLSDKFEKQLVEKEYSYEPYTLKYYKNIVSIYKGKCIGLLNIIEHILNKKTNGILDLLNEYDITINSNGFILYDDIFRLVDPFVYNYKMLNIKLREANNLNTYLVKKVSLDRLYRAGGSEDDLYPSEKLQSYAYSNNEGYIPLTNNQENKYLEETSENVNAIFDVFDDGSKVLRRK